MREGNTTEMVLGFFLGFVFGILAFLFLCLRSSGVSRKFKNGIMMGFLGRLCLSIYAENQRFEQMRHQKNSLSNQYNRDKFETPESLNFQEIGSNKHVKQVKVYSHDVKDGVSQPTKITEFNIDNVLGNQP